MASILIEDSLERHEENLKKAFRSAENKIGMCICLDKPAMSLKKTLEAIGIECEKIFFIDCISASLNIAKNFENVFYIRDPSDLETIKQVVNEFVNKISESKYIVIDALTTFLIYNTEKKVLDFLDFLTKLENTDVYILSLKGSDFTSKIVSFFESII